jgi:hypothetical protein
MTLQTTHDRRTHPRVGFQGVVFVRNAKKKIPCQALNLSETGILVRPSRRANPGSQFRVTFRLSPPPAPPDCNAQPEATGWLDVEGKLVHRTWIKERISWGIQFVCIPESVRDLLRDFVETDTEPPTPRTLQRGSVLQPLPEIKVHVTEEGDEKGEGPTRQVDRAQLRQLAQVSEMDDTGELRLEEIERLVRAMTPIDD